MLITGATGHVGGRLFRELTTRDTCEIRALIRSARTLPSWASTSEICFGDLTEDEIHASILPEIDVVVHLATRGFSATAAPTPLETAVECNSTLAFARNAIARGVTRFVFVSSIHVYGSMLNGVVDDFTPTVPMSDYGRSRLKIENELLALANETSTEVIVIRMTNSFGVPAFPRPETWSLLLHDVCRQVIETSSITLRSDDRTCRDMFALSDAVEVLSEIVSSSRLTSGTYLLASGETMTIRDLAELVQQQAVEVLGINPVINSQHTDEEPPKTFSLKSRKLRDAGFMIPDRRTKEIRDLLISAASEFELHR